MNSSKHILFTRLISDPSKALLAKQNLKWSEHSFINVEYNSDEKQIDIINEQELPLVFTSRHSVLSIHQTELESNKRISNRSCFAISPITQKIAIECGFKVIGHAPNSEKLANVIIKANELGVFHPTAIQRREELYHSLESRNIKVIPIITYQKTISPNKIDSIDIIAFFSPSQIMAFLESNEIQKNQTVFCIGQTTANHARKHSFENIIVPSVSSEDEITKSIIQYANSYE